MFNVPLDIKIGHLETPRSAIFLQQLIGDMKINDGVYTLCFKNNPFEF